MKSKKLIAFALVISMLICSMLILSVNAEEACSHPYGWSYRTKEHTKIGGSCTVYEEYYCHVCNYIAQPYTKMTYGICPGGQGHAYP